MAGSLDTYRAWRHGRQVHSLQKGDIELPNRSGQTDPRLRKPDVMGSLRRAKEGVGILKKRGLLGGKR